MRFFGKNVDNVCCFRPLFPLVPGTMITLGLLWIAWCAMHSLLISTVFLDLLERRAQWLLRYHRLLYNGVSLITILPLILFTRQVAPEVVFSWSGPAIVLRGLLLAGAAALFIGGAKRYELDIFLGLRQLHSGDAEQLLSERVEFTTEGVFGMTRHPWYLGSLFFLWSVFPAYSTGVLLAVVILSIYLVIGTWLEEKKILARHGTAYRRYSTQVSMLFPGRWLLRKWSERANRGRP
jgi:methanethiol S-methyltransferase